FVPDQSFIDSDCIIRGHDGRFFNDSPFYIPYGTVCSYSARSRSEGGLLPILPATKDFFFFRVAGISVMTDTYDLYNFKDVVYPEDLKGFAPRQKVTLLNTGDIWLRVMSKVRKHEKVTYRLNEALGKNIKKTIKEIGMFASSTGTGLRQIKGEWLTNANPGEVALARIYEPLDPGDPIIQGDDPIDPLDPFG
ncbi:MAG: hypothetical protein AAFR37_12245, partial [Cyanobacteria bacterium J06628_3]